MTSYRKLGLRLPLTFNTLPEPVGPRDLWAFPPRVSHGTFHARTCPNCSYVQVCRPELVLPADSHPCVDNGHRVTMVWCAA